MPVSSQALTLMDWASQSKSAANLKITMSLLENGGVLDDLKLVTNPSLEVKGRRITGADLPTTGWGRINQAPANIKTTVRPFEEQVSLVRELIQVDRRLKSQTNWIDDPFATQIDGAAKAHMYDINDAFFNNDPTVSGYNQDAIVGLKGRLSDPATFGLPVVSGYTPLAINGSSAAVGNNPALSLNLQNSMTQADALNFLETIGQAFAYLGASDGRDCVAYCNWKVKERWLRAARLLNQAFRIDTDAFGREVEMYRQCKVRDIGFKKDQTSLILSNTESSNGSAVTGGSACSIYIVRYGDNYFKGWQTNILEPEYLGTSTETGIYENVLIDWGFGLYYSNTRSFVRIFGIPIN